MTDLVHMKCEVCRADSPKVTEDEMKEYIQQIPEWEVIERNGVNCLNRVFAFKDFSEALAFTNRVGALAEEQGHHPEILTEWGKVTVTWWTHKIHGLHKNDFAMAAKTDRLL